jgi:hypothetical protein
MEIYVHFSIGKHEKLSVRGARIPEFVRIPLAGQNFNSAFVLKLSPVAGVGGVD